MDVIAALVYWPLARLSRLIERLGGRVGNLSLSYYRHHRLYEMRADVWGSFGAVIVRSLAKTATRLQEILDFDERYQALRSGAIETWRDKPTYSESVLGRCRALLFDSPVGR